MNTKSSAGAFQAPLLTSVTNDLRNPGGGSPGPQYPQGLVHGDNFYVIMSMNKEDIWVTQIPLASL